MQARREGERREEALMGPELSAVLTHGGPLGFELQTTVYKNKFLLPCYKYYWSWWTPIGLGGPLLVLVDPYWSWWTPIGLGGLLSVLVGPRLQPSQPYR